MGNARAPDYVCMTVTATTPLAQIRTKNRSCEPERWISDKAPALPSLVSLNDEHDEIQDQESGSLDSEGSDCEFRASRVHVSPATSDRRAHSSRSPSAHTLAYTILALEGAAAAALSSLRSKFRVCMSDRLLVAFGDGSASRNHCWAMHRASTS